MSDRIRHVTRPSNRAKPTGMDYGHVNQIKMEITVSEFDAEDVIIEFDQRKTMLDPSELWNWGDRSLGQGIIEFAKTRKETIADIPFEPGVTRWLLIPLGDNEVGVQMMAMPNKALAKHVSSADGKVELKFTCDLLTLVDGYRLMLRQFLDEHGEDKYEDFFNESFPMSELEALDQIAEKFES